MGFALIQATASHGSTPPKNHRMAGRKGKRDSGQGLGRVYYEEKG